MSHPSVILGSMDEQLRILDVETAPRRRLAARRTPGWEIDDRTREIGLKGLRDAREALRQAGARRAA